MGKGYTDMSGVQETLNSAPGDVLWVFSQPKRPYTRDGVTREDLEVQLHSLECVRDRMVLLPLNPYWQHARGDDRRLMVDCELALYCSLILVFDSGCDRCKWWRKQAEVNPKVRLIGGDK